jgi:hypothetical protein
MVSLRLCAYLAPWREILALSFNFQIMKRRSRIYLANEQEPLPVQVKRKVISAGHLAGTTPETLAESSNLSSDLLFGTNEYALLCLKLQKLVFEKKPDAELTCSQVSACETVQDCIDLVESTIKS